MGISNWTRNKLIGWLNREPEHPADRLSDFDLLKDEIKVGDVLLVEGQSQVSNIIKIVTQSPWSHAAIFIGRIRDIETEALRERSDIHFSGADDTPLLIEAILGKGTILTPLEEYRPFRIRLCRPGTISLEDRELVISFVIGKLGADYNLRQVVDLARFLFPYGILPRRWRSSLFHHNAGTETRTVCSTLIADAFQNVSYPILPVLQEDDFGYKELTHRNSRLFSPQDFDISPWFDILKFPLQSFDDEASYSKMPWKNEVGSGKGESRKEI